MEEVAGVWKSAICKQRQTRRWECERRDPLRRAVAPIGSSQSVIDGRKTGSADSEINAVTIIIKTTRVHHHHAAAQEDTAPTPPVVEETDHQAPAEEEAEEINTTTPPVAGIVAAEGEATRETDPDRERETDRDHEREATTDEDAAVVDHPRKTEKPTPVTTDNTTATTEGTADGRRGTTEVIGMLAKVEVGDHHQQTTTTTTAGAAENQHLVTAEPRRNQVTIVIDG